MVVATVTATYCQTAGNRFDRDFVKFMFNVYVQPYGYDRTSNTSSSRSEILHIPHPLPEQNERSCSIWFFLLGI